MLYLFVSSPCGGASFITPIPPGGRIILPPGAVLARLLIIGDDNGDTIEELIIVLGCPGLRTPDGVFIEDEDGLVALVETVCSEPSSMASLSFKLALILSNDAAVVVWRCSGPCTLTPPVTR